MTETIHKYLIGPYGTTINVSEMAVPLYVGIQDGSLFVWVQTDPASPQATPMDLIVRGTGHPFDGTEGHYIGSTQMDSVMGELVWHVYRRRP